MRIDLVYYRLFFQPITIYKTLFTQYFLHIVDKSRRREQNLKERKGTPMNRSTPLQICLALATVATVSCGGPKGSEGSEIAAISAAAKKSPPAQTECRMYVGNVTAEGVYSPVTVWAQACPRWPSLQPKDSAGGS